MTEPAKTSILEAFAHVAYPGDDHLVVNQTGSDPECNEILDAFRGKTWMEVSAQEVRRFAEALPLFTPAAFRYFLPAYMVACLDAPQEADVAKDFLLFNLTPPRDTSGWEFRFFRARADGFGPAERAAIASFLSVMKQLEAEDWASAGRPVPTNNLERALAYWSLP